MAVFLYETFAFVALCCFGCSIYEKITDQKAVIQDHQAKWQCHSIVINLQGWFFYILLILDLSNHCQVVPEGSFSVSLNI